MLSLRFLIEFEIIKILIIILIINKFINIIIILLILNITWFFIIFFIYKIKLNLIQVIFYHDLNINFKKIILII